MAIAHVRPATPDDAPAVTAVQREVWTTAWAGFLPAGLTEGFDDDAVTAAWARTAAGPGLWVATEGDTVAGFCLAGPATEEDVADAVGAVPDDAGRVGLVATLLVSPRWGRRGHGGRLLVAAAEGLRTAGAARGITWVPERDAASRAFYAARGLGAGRHGAHPRRRGPAPARGATRWPAGPRVRPRADRRRPRPTAPLSSE